MEDELISIIVPVYNVENYLSKCVKSLLNQTYSKYEIILIDDGSSDESGKLCDWWAEKSKIIKVFHKKNGGLSSARNFGIDKSTGKYLSFIDSDDYVEPNFLDALYNNMKKYNSNISICSNYYTYKNKDIKRKNHGLELKLDFYDAFVNMNRGCDFDMAIWNKLYKRELFDQIRFPIDKLSEDYFVMCKLFYFGKSISFTPLHLYHYVQRNNSITHSKKINHDFLEAAFKQLKFVNEVEPLLKKEAIIAICSSYLTVYDFYLKEKQKPTKDFLEEAINFILENKSIIKNSDISVKKMLQFKLFVRNRFLYNIIFKIYRKVKHFQ